MNEDVPESLAKGDLKKSDERWKSVDLPMNLFVEVEELLKKKHERRPVQVSVGLFIADLIRDSLNSAKLREEYPLVLEIYAVESDCVYIRDNIRDVVAELRFKDGSDLYCNIDGAKNCVHIGFAWAISEVQRLILDKRKET